MQFEERLQAEDADALGIEGAVPTGCPGRVPIPPFRA